MRFRLREGDTPLISRLPARMVAITCLILVAMVIGLAWTREAGNNNARQNEETRIAAALDARLHGIILETLDASARLPAARTPKQAKPPEAGLALFSFDAEPAALVWGSGAATALSRALLDPLKAASENLATSLRGAIVEHTPTGGASWQLHARHASSGFAKAGDEIFAWALVPAEQVSATGERKAYAILRHKQVDSAFLANLAAEAQAAVVRLHPATQEVGGNTFRFARAGEPVLVAWRADRPGDRFSTQLGAILISVMALYTGLVAYYMTRKLAESEMDKARLAAQDVLTTLPNRLLFTIQVEDEIARSRRNNSDFALYYIDFDRFKEVNDSFGHDAGDLLIIAASRRLESVMREGDRLARFGGDEFGFIQIDVKSLHDCEVLAERLLNCMRDPFEISGQNVNISISIGITISRGGAEDRSELMRRADLALYRAKNQGRNRYVFFDEEMNSELQRQKRTEDELRHAIASDELEVYYQPVVEAGSHKLAGVEALVRWNHPERGMIRPQEFISIAEERGLISDLGRWVFRRACQDATHWPGIKLAVNVSAIQFRQKDFLDNIKQALEETGFDPGRLELELTESAVIDDADQAEAIIIELRSMGVRIALDDFGTGYSSLIYLRRFAIDKIKIDRSFVDIMESSVESREIVRNVADLGCRLGLTVTAEGVENESQIPLLESFGCHELQGYYFGKPLSRLQLPVLIAAGKVRRLEREAAALAATQAA